jgi:uncharacterized protein (DUF1778 family)
MADKERPPGRPKLPPGQAKGLRVSFRVAREERERIHRAAAEDGVSPSEWIRRAVLSSLQDRK